MQQRTLEQQIAEAEARLARLRTQSRQLENGQKIILGGMLLAAAQGVRELHGIPSHGVG